MRYTNRALTIALTVAIALLVMPGECAAQIRATPDIKTPSNYQPGTGVDRNGIKSNSSNRRNRNYVVPSGGYYYGWYPGGGSYYSGGYYSNPRYDANRYACPYCGNRWCNGSCRYRGPIVYPPVVGDAGALFGPRAVRDFIGPGGGNQNAGGNANPLRVAAAQAPRVPPKISNPTVRARAWKFVEYGDHHFKRGNYRKAAERYRKAQSQAADIADVYFRQGFAELGIGRYAKAVVAIEKGLTLKPDWPSSGFVLEELYPTSEAKRAVFRQLHSFVAEHPNDADAQFILAVLQHFDGQSEAAEVRFRRVVELTGDQGHARAFLPLEPEEPAAEEPES